MADLPQFAVSIQQPWAWAIIHAGKDVENRSWRTRFRGPVCIHAARGMTAAGFNGFMRTIHDVSLTKPFPPGSSVPNEKALDRGGIIGAAEIVDCVDTSESPWFFGPYAFVLRNPRPVPFIPVKGALGFFRWRDQMPGVRDG